MLVYDALCPEAEDGEALSRAAEWASLHDDLL
jgi:hypothetical protein